MESKVKYTAIQGSLGQVSDRYMPGGYREGDLPFAQIIDGLIKIKELDGVEICHKYVGEASEPRLIKDLLSTRGIPISFVHCNLFGERKWQNCSLSSKELATRQEAIRLTKLTMDYAEAVGAPSVNLWLGQDGFDYPLCTDYKSQWENLVESVQILADYKPHVNLSLEGKLREPRNRCLVDTSMSALLLALEADRENVGVVIDNGHVLQAGQNIAQNIEIVAKYGKLFGMHVNDNYGSWDDDMIFGSVRLTELIEMFYSLRKIGYDKGLAVDIYPYRENPFRATEESILNMIKINEMVDRIGFTKLTELREEGDACEMTKAIREAIF